MFPQHNSSGLSSSAASLVLESGSSSLAEGRRRDRGLAIYDLKMARPYAGLDQGFG